MSTRFTVHVGKKLTNLLLEGGERNWSSRFLYLGAKGARAWREVEKDSKYSGRKELTAVHHAIRDLANDNNLKNYDTIISIRPGIRLLDKEVISYLRGKQIIKYIPIDINYYLAVSAAESLDRAYADVRIPFCIIGDFEDGMGSIAETIRNHSSPGRLFMMLGGTFGNLEKQENSFLRGLSDCLDREDKALLDIFIARDNYNIKRDPLLPLSAQPASVRKFIAGAIGRRFGESIDEVFENIGDYVEISESISSVAGTASLKIIHKKSGKNVIHVRRYNYDEFGKHLSSTGFEVLASRETGGSSDPVGRAVFFVRKK